MAVVSVGRDNGYGLPSAETLGRLEPRPVFRTDLHGDMGVSTDGERLWIKPQRSEEYKTSEPSWTPLGLPPWARD